MLTETTAEKRILTDVLIKRADSLTSGNKEALAKLFFETWEKENLCNSLDEARRKIAKYDLSATFVLIEKSGEIYGSLFTKLVKAKNIKYLLTNQIPTYQSVEKYQYKKVEGDYQTFLVCFSLNAKKDFRVKLPIMSKDSSISRFMISTIPFPPNALKGAYSRIGYLGENNNPLTYYLENLATPKKLNSVGLHENFGGITVAIMENSRPEDKKGGGANFYVHYPKDENEQKKINEIKARRLKIRPEIERVGNIIFFKDYKLPKLEDFIPS